MREVVPERLGSPYWATAGNAYFCATPYGYRPAKSAHKKGHGVKPNMLSDPATAVAEAITGIYSRQESLLRGAHAWDEVKSLLAGSSVRVRTTISPRLAPVDYDMMLMTSLVDLQWRRARIVYAIDPDMLAELTSSTSATLPGAVFRRLPHTSPLVVFPQPIPTTLATGEPGEIYGFYVYGIEGDPGSRKRRFLLTDDPNVTRLGLMFVTAVLNDRGQRVDWDATRVSFPVNVERFDVESTIKTVIDNYIAGTGLSTVPRPALTAWLNSLLPWALNLLLYLCTDEPDFQHMPPARRATGKKKGGKTKPGRTKPTRLIKVGWRLGPALRAARRAATARRATGAGHSQLPHQRRGHFKTQRHGPGRTETKVIYVLPYMVRLDLLSQQPLEHRVIPIT